MYAKSIHSFSLGRCQAWLSKRFDEGSCSFCSIHSFLCNCGDRMERLDRLLTTFSMAKTSGKAQCAPYYKNTITYSTSVYYYYKSLPSKSLTITFMWRLPIPRDAPWRISILISIITMMLLLLLLLLLFLLFLLLLFLLLLLLLLLLQLLLLLLLLLLVVVERINYSVIHMMSGMSTLTGPGIPMLTGPGAPVPTGSGTWMPTLAGPGMPTLADSRMSVLMLTLTSHITWIKHSMQQLRV